MLKPLLRPIESAPILHPGEDFEYPALKGCPDCGGRGWLYENPFAEYGRVTRACPTCWAAKKHFDEHGELPADIAAALTANVELRRGAPAVGERDAGKPSPRT